MCCIRCISFVAGGGELVNDYVCFFGGIFFCKVKLGLTYVCCVMNANGIDLGPLLTWVDAAVC
jgi:hypothetical protein